MWKSFYNKHVRNFLSWAGTKMIIAANNTDKLNDLDYIALRLSYWIGSPERIMQLDGERYYRGEHDVLKKKRTVIGADGKLTELTYLPNNKCIDNHYGKNVDQKTNYLLGQPLSFKCDDDEYVKSLRKVFNKRFHRTFNTVGLTAINQGIAWLYIYYQDNELKFRMFPGYEIMPIWTDRAHTEYVKLVRYFIEEKPGAVDPHDVIEKVEIYSADGIDYYTYTSGRLVPDVQKPHANYLTTTMGDAKTESNWVRIPVIPFKFNSKEIPLILRAKNLQDAYNELISRWKDVTEEDSRNTIIVLENYDGTNLAEFRKNLMQYSAVKVMSRAGSGSRGDVRTLQVEVNAENYEAIRSVFEKAILKNCKGYDLSELKSGSPNQMNIKSIYSDIDLDANMMETEFQASMEDVMWFVNAHLGVNGDEKDLEIIFNRDGVVNESEIIQNMTSMGVEVSNKTKLSQLPFIDDPDAEQERVDKEKEEAMDAYAEQLSMTGDAAPKAPKGGMTDDKPKQ